MVKCPKCGKEINDAHVVCEYCGYDFQKQDAKTPPAKETKSNTKIIAVVAIIVVIAIVGVLASGMFSNNNSSDDATVKDTSDSSKDVKQDTSSSSNDDSASTEYWASVKADKFHLPTCEWAKKISDDNKIVYDSREDAIADGKEPCGACNP